MATLFQRGQLDGFLRSLIGVAHTRIDQLSEDVLLARSTEDLVQELKMVAYIEPLVIDDEWSEGSVDDTMLQAGVEIPPDPLGRRGQVLAFSVFRDFLLLGIRVPMPLGGQWAAARRSCRSP